MYSLEAINFIAVSIVGLLAILGVIASYRRARKTGQTARIWLENWLSDFSTEMVGAFLTAILFGILIGSVQQAQDQANLRDSLARRMGSPYGTTALDASRELMSLGWLSD